jgi:hypothetical protein
LPSQVKGGGLKISTGQAGWESRSRRPDLSGAEGFVGSNPTPRTFSYYYYEDGLGNGWGRVGAPVLLLM